MTAMRVIAIATEIAESVRALHKDPQYGFPAYTQAGGVDAPCRHCLRRIGPHQRATLFTYDAFRGQEKLPLPGPVYIHADACERYQETAGFPPDMSAHRTLNAYSRGRKLVAQEYVEGENLEPKLDALFARDDVDYVHVRSTQAGCYAFRIERG